MPRRLAGIALGAFPRLLTLFLPPPQPVKKKQRARTIEFFIDVAQECFNIGNFNSLMAIISECWTPPGAAVSPPLPLNFLSLLSWDEHESRRQAEEDLEQSQHRQV